MSLGHLPVSLGSSRILLEEKKFLISGSPEIDFYISFLKQEICFDSKFERLFEKLI